MLVWHIQTDINGSASVLVPSWTSTAPPCLRSGGCLSWPRLAHIRWLQSSHVRQRPGEAPHHSISPLVKRPIFAYPRWCSVTALPRCRQPAGTAFRRPVRSARRLEPGSLGCRLKRCGRSIPLQHCPAAARRSGRFQTCPGGRIMTARRWVVTHRQNIPAFLDRSGNGPLGSKKVRDFRYRPRTFMGESG